MKTTSLDLEDRWTQTLDLPRYLSIYLSIYTSIKSSNHLYIYLYDSYEDY